ncbi:hypothetical protein ACFYYH_02300 [Streptomyces sp. NPDC002018]|uniref:hypothetical protein n=1 Tax=Streptomyces sp. NPDC002018 TaxID=3364629 RepID=UPI00368AE8BA
MRGLRGVGTNGRGVLLGALVAGALILAGCVEDGLGASRTGEAGPAPSAPTASPPPTGGCGDTDCEVELTAGDAIRFGGRDHAGRFEITAVDARGARWKLPGSRRCGASGPGDIRVASDNDGCRGRAGEGTTLRAEGVLVTLLAIEGETVRVRLRPWA